MGRREVDPTMSKPTTRHALRAALLSLTAGLFLPGALAAQGATSAALPSTVQVPVLQALPSGPPGDAVPRSAAHLHGRADPGPDLTSRAVPELLLPELAGDGARHPMVRVGTPAVMDSRAPNPPSVLDAVFPLADPAGADEEDARESLGGLGDVLPRKLCRDLVELRPGCDGTGACSSGTGGSSDGESWTARGSSPGSDSTCRRIRTRASASRWSRTDVREISRSFPA